MRLNGMIDAAVNGGIAKYQEAFFGEDFAVNNPQNATHVTRLKELFLEQVKFYVNNLLLTS